MFRILVYRINLSTNSSVCYIEIIIELLMVTKYRNITFKRHCTQLLRDKKKEEGKGGKSLGKILIFSHQL